MATYKPQLGRRSAKHKKTPEMFSVLGSGKNKRKGGQDNRAVRTTDREREK